MPAVCMDIHSRKFNTTNGLPEGNVRSVIQDSKGFIWMGSPNGLYRFDNYFYTTYKYSAKGNNRLLHNNNIRGLFNLPDGRLLIAEQGDLFSVFDVNKNQFVDLPASTMQKMYTNARKKHVDDNLLQRYSQYKSKSVDVINDNLGNIILVGNDGSILFVDKATGEAIELQVYDKDLLSMVNGKKYKVVTSRKNNLIWVSTNGCGMTVYDRQTKTTRHIRQGSGLISTDFILDMCLDKDDNVWVADEYHGVDCLTAINASPIILLDNAARSMRSNQVYVMEWMPNKQVLIANTLGDAYVTNSDLVLPQQPTERGINIHSACVDKSGELWIGTRLNGIVIGNKWNLTHNPKDKSSVSANNIFDILCDRKGRMWVAAENANLDLAVKNSDGSFSFRHFFSKDFSPRVLLQDRKGNIWVGARNGLYCFNPDELLKNASAYKLVIPIQRTGFSDISCLFQDTKGNIWMGTYGNGVYCIQPNTTEDGATSLFNISTANGLSSNEVNTVIEDNNGKIWIGTNNGITIYDTKTKKRSYYFDEYDLMRNYCNCSLLMPDGKLAFGTNAGILVLDPNYPTGKLAGAPQLLITGILINGSSNWQDDNGNLQECSPDELKELVLSHDQNSLTIRFSTFNYKAVSSTRYSYMLEGYDKSWSELSAYSFATYKNLPPGTYTFHVKAYDNNSSSDTEKQLTIVIKQPWWNTWWAYCIYLLVAIVAGLLIYRQLKTVYTLRQNITLEKKMTAFKLQFFTNISHEFRTPLTIIQGAMKRISGLTIPADMRQPVSNMSKSVARMLRLINQLLEFRKMQEGKLSLNLEETDVVKFIDDIFLTFKDVADNKQINYIFMPQKKSAKVFVDRSNLDKILYNILSNAFKYTPSHGTIQLKLDFADDRMIICIEDNGVGISKDVESRLFQRYTSGKDSNDSIGIGLSLTKALVNVHHGVITYKPNTPRGSIFTVELPTDKSVYKAEDFMSPKHTALEEKGSDNDTPIDKYKELAPPPINNRCVLIVEDDTDVLNYLQEVLQKYFVVHIAMNGVEAIDKLESLTPDIIVSDVMMPLMNGLEFMERIRSNEKTKDIPIILLTALTDDKNRIKAIKNGADAYITKPFDPQLLVTTVANLIEKNDTLKAKYAVKDNKEKVTPPAVIVEERDKKLLDVFDLWIYSHIDDSQLSVDDAAEAMGYNRSKFFRKIKSLTGQSPADYIKTIRLNKAVELLKSETTTVAEVCYKVGFNNPNYFAKVFKAYFGVSPKKYQQGQPTSEQSQPSNQ